MVRTGLERVLSGEVTLLRGKRVALLCNPTAVDTRLRHVADVIGETGAQLVALFGPEHGVRGDAQDMVGVGEAKDSVTGVPMHSLYGEDERSLWPRPEWLAGVDCVVYDIQDVGSRYYTYVWTLLHVMQVAAPLGVQVVVLDRPNPIGGVEVEGGAIADGYRSFVGRASIPNRHGLTAGEIARAVNETEGVGARLEVVPMTGWRRDMYYDETGLPWVQPSPNMPTLDTALVYPGGCLVEGTELSEGRGTTRPFEQIGAPFVSYREAHEMCDALGREDLPGVRFRPLVFQPTFHKFGGKRCGGVALHVVDRRAFRPYLTYVAILRELRRRYPTRFQWRSRPYEFIADKPAIDLLCGGPAVREGIDAGASLAELAATWKDAEDAFRAARARWLLY
jgi:uncharacterized protein YbbC (DUF1343 family)